MRLLCLSNGHGEDVIALKVLQQLQAQPQPPEIAALPLVGKGAAYQQAGIEIIGPTRYMPSGGFIYMDGGQIWRDVRSGLLELLGQQWQAIAQWSREGGKILAVGDIVPLFLAWLSGGDYFFLGTAKSDYYLRDEQGRLPGRPWTDGWSGSVYLPWERWLMRSPQCLAVFPRDRMTTEILQAKGIRAMDLGNPMLDGLDSHLDIPEEQRRLTILLLPGSRPPEAYANWRVILQSLPELLKRFPRVLLVAAIAPGLEEDSLTQPLADHGWQTTTPTGWLHSDPQASQFSQGDAVLILARAAYPEIMQRADLAIAMAGTATEQFVGLGKPAIAIPGEGPQFTYAFAEAQSRLLGCSLQLVPDAQAVAAAAHQILQDADRLQEIAANGKRRFGSPGASARIAEQIMFLLQGEV